MIFYGDIETFSTVPLKHGVYKYAEHAEILLFTWASDDEPVRVVDLTAKQALGPLKNAIDAADEVVFHNSMFDRTVLRLQAPTLCPPIEKWRDTMVMALAHSLPGALKKLCHILKVDADLAKLKIGKSLIHLFCKPLPKNRELRRATRETHPVEWRQFIEYAVHDVEAMRAIYKKLPRWNYGTGSPAARRELALWHLDQRINDRGMAVDVDLAHACIKTVDRVKKKLSERTAELTAGAVEATTQRDKLLAYLLREHGVHLPDMKGDTLERRITDPELPDGVKELLKNRLQASSTSPAKYQALVRGVSADGRLRGTKQFCGAGRTGRWSGRVFQPDNLMRVPKHIKAIYDDVIAGIKADGADLVFENPIEAMAAVVRGSIIPGPGKKFAISDLSNIEGRGLAWQAGEGWKLKAFADYDAGEGYDLYVLAAARAFGITPEEVMADDKAGGVLRQIGKVLELALGYQGGVGAFVSMAANYGIDLEVMAQKAMPAIEAELLEAGYKAWEKAGTGEATFDLSPEVFKVCWALTQMWRTTNPNIVSYWWDLQGAVKKAIRSPSNALAVGPLQIDRKKNWLRIRLPSGRFLCYPQPEVDINGKISYMGVNQYTKQWDRIDTYGGKLAENVTQAIARDVLADRMPTIEAEGFELVLHVHDEPVAEVDIGAPKEKIDRLGEILRTNPEWAEGLPLAAKSHEAMRYRKED